MTGGMGKGRGGDGRDEGREGRQRREREGEGVWDETTVLHSTYGRRCGGLPSVGAVLN